MSFSTLSFERKLEFFDALEAFDGGSWNHYSTKVEIDFDIDSFSAVEASEYAHLWNASLRATREALGQWSNVWEFTPDEAHLQILFMREISGVYRIGSGDRICE